MRKSRVLSACAAAALVLLAACGQSDSTDSGSNKFSRLEIIAPAAPGSGWDQTARAVQAAFEADDLARSVEVTNVEGASGTVALAQVAPQKGKKDLLIASGLAMMSGIISNGTSVTLDDLTPVARLMGEYEVIVTPKNSPYKDVASLFAAIKENPKKVAIAGGSAGSADHIYIGLLAKHFGVDPADVNYVPYSGGGEATTALLGGKVQAGISGLNEFAEQIKAGKLEGLLISSAKDVGTIRFAQNASDVDASLEFQNWRSLMAPGGISGDLEKRYVAAAQSMHDSASWKKALTTNGWNDNFISGDEFDTWLDEENERVKGVLADLGLAK